MLTNVRQYHLDAYTFQLSKFPGCVGVYNRTSPSSSRADDRGGPAWNLLSVDVECEESKPVRFGEFCGFEILSCSSTELLYSSASALEARLSHIED